MTDASIEKAVCEKCGADVRENTVFCFNCGGPVGAASALEENGAGAAADPAAKAALDDLAAKMKGQSDAEDKLARAASERKKARVTQRKPKGIVWEPADDSPAIYVILVAVVVALIAACIVIFAVYWK